MQLLIKTFQNDEKQKRTKKILKDSLKKKQEKIV